jgi:hypothetical protein
MRPRLIARLTAAALFFVAAPAGALPSLQLGAGSGSWTYNVVTQTWETSDNPLELLAFANATAADGGNGDYAWSVTGSSQIAYLVVSAVPKIATTEPPSLFDITVDNDGGTLSLYTSGNGAPPLSDPNDLAPHGIFSTYFEIYEFNFDGGFTGIYNTQTGLDPATGFEERFDITINSLDASVSALHFDLFTIAGTGQLGPTDQVFANAPFSHDAQTIPEPVAAALLAAGLAGLGAAAARKRG